ncbi:molecular chaperone DnaJ [Yunchengibacter salinarum]|uniref:molecular chaperone DnaJ n=1 Tax=Yunchengibacter salinarum TaxID=3133399 RepID=UPI0035B698F4
MIVALLAGVALAAFLFLLLHWWAGARTRDARRALFWLALLVSLLLGGVLMARTGLSLISLAPTLLTLGRMLFAKRGAARTGTGTGAGGQAGKRQAPHSGAMSHAEALSVLGLEAGATEQDIRAAHRRLISRLHPDQGGSDWLAAKLNAARQRLLDDGADEA